MACKDCLRAAKALRTEVAQLALRRAKRWGIAGAFFGVLVALLTVGSGSRPVSSLELAVRILHLALGLAYMFWAGYWAFRALWGSVVRPIFGRIHPVLLLLLFPVSLSVFSFIFALVCSYGWLGGGLYQWVKHKRRCHSRVNRTLIGAYAAVMLGTLLASAYLKGSSHPIKDSSPSEIWGIPKIDPLIAGSREVNPLFAEVEPYAHCELLKYEVQSELDPPDPLLAIFQGVVESYPEDMRARILLAYFWARAGNNVRL